MKQLALLLALIGLLGCPQPVAPPPPDSGDAALVGDASASCITMCSHLASIGCLVGADPNCVQACSQNAAAPITPMPIACLAGAADKAAANGCGAGVVCP